MNVRNGTFTGYRNYPLELSEDRTEAPIADEEKEYLIVYNLDDTCPFEDFRKSPDGFYYKAVPFKERANAYPLRTFGIYKGKKVHVFGWNRGVEGAAGISVSDKHMAQELGMVYVEAIPSGMTGKVLFSIILKHSQ